jgi:pantoate--beta-alanine ligase
LSARVTRRVRTVAELRRILAGWRRRGDRIGFVPTMGAIHEGHLGLMRSAARAADRVVVSVFVNPLQFGPGEDYRRYPRPRARDRARLAAAGVDLVWEPPVTELYPPGERTRVRVTGLDTVLEGASRPGHFEGVATVVLKLLHAVQPDDLWLGQKDAQQARVIEQMCDDLLVPVHVRRGPTSRESDGLARSSRNAYLKPDERREAVALWKGLEAARAALAQGERSASALARAVRKAWRRHPAVREDYVAVVDAHTLEPVRAVRGRVLIAVAARVGRARLIDNLEWEPR